jgi:hypothetical protein
MFDGDTYDNPVDLGLHYDKLINFQAAMSQLQRVMHWNMCKKN